MSLPLFQGIRKFDLPFVEHLLNARYSCVNTDNFNIISHMIQEAIDSERLAITQSVSSMAGWYP